MGLGFTLVKGDSRTCARRGVVHTCHGDFDTPAFMPVGTLASVKGIWPEQLKALGAQIVLSNTYHLCLRPGEDLVQKMGGLHGFMQWDGPILTDSGGYQVFSLESRRKIEEQGVTFKSHIDGAQLFLSPEKSIEIQNKLGADIIMAFDECPALPCDRQTMHDSILRTHRWLKRCDQAHARKDEQMLFGIVQGGLDHDLRLESLELTEQVDLPGIAIGGLSVGESHGERVDVLEKMKGNLPDAKPHYLMGVGTPRDIVDAVARGIDMFDCVMPTREGRHGVAYTSAGKLRIKNQQHAASELPLDEACDCACCEKFTRAYLRHLFVAGEPLGQMALSLHNLHYYQNLMAKIRVAVETDEFSELLESIAEIYPVESD